MLALGIESGIFEVSGRYYDGCFVCAYDGARHHLGLSCAFEVPPRALHPPTSALCAPNYVLPKYACSTRPLPRTLGRPEPYP